MPKRVVLISTVYPYPEDNGKKAFLGRLVRYLANRHGAENLHYLLVGAAPGERALDSQEYHLHVVSKPRSIQQITNVLWYTLLWRSKSIQESMLYSAELGQELKNMVADIQPDLVIYDTLRIGQFFEHGNRTGSQHVLNMDDLFSVRYRRMIRVLTDYPELTLNVLGNFASFVPRIFRRLIQNRAVQLMTLRLEQKLIARREIQVTKWFDKALLVNSEEAAYLRGATGLDNVRVFKRLVQDPSGAQRDYKGEPRFVFMGDMSVPHNEHAITNFISTQLQPLLQLMPKAQLIVIGRGVSPDVRAMANRFGDAVRFEGFVQDLSLAFSQSCAMLVPLLFGSGVKTKTIDALAYGLPVIATDIGVEGIPLNNSSGCVVENDLNRYPEIMARLCDVECNRTLSEQAESFYQDHFGYSVVLEEYADLFGV